MTLGELIETLEGADPDLVVPWGFTNPHSYRGYYEQLAFSPASNVTIGAMLADAKSALNATFQGWKGGDYTMHKHTDCWIAIEGQSDGELIGPVLLRYMLAAAKPQPTHVPPHPLEISALTDDNNDPTEARQFGVRDPEGITHVYGDQSWVAYGTCIEDGTHPGGTIRYRDITITYGEWQDA